MIRHASQLLKLELSARDGVLGRVRDFHFDDENWIIRYLVAETGTWLNSRRVLIATSALEAADWEAGLLQVNLTKEQVRRSPEVDADQAVSREQETGLGRHYGWPLYWNGEAFAGGVTAAAWGAAATVPGTLAAAAESVRTGAEPASTPRGDPRLRRASAVRGYKLEAIDGSIGHIEDFLFEDLTWELSFLVIDTHVWLPGRKVLVSPDWVSAVSWPRARVYLDLSRDAIRSAPVHDPHTPLSAEQARTLRRHHWVSRPKTRE